MDEIKSGNELCDEFFQGIKEDEKVDKMISKKLEELYKNDELTNEKVLKMLKELRDSEDAAES